MRRLTPLILSNPDMVIGIFGGSFNPVHKGHIAIARRALSQTDIEEGWFVVSPHNPFKKHENLIDDNLRLAMVSEALRGEKGMVCSDYEFRLPRPSYMSFTLQSLVRDYPENTFVLLIGADNWDSFPRWRDSEGILSRHRVVIYPRRGYEIDARALPAGVELLDVPLYDISATEIRRRIAQGADAEELADERVLAMLRERNE
ncbi:MAG: nicotinate-nucleotide adenylyltransferase [Prevotella sp.]|nr:nicotinate-nucleotide adenylyltransferase [Prevotella sp.]